MSKSLRFFAALGLVASVAARADPGYYVVTPYDNEGVRTVDIRYWTVKPRHGAETVWPELGFGLGVNSRWTTEFFVSWIGPSDLAVRQSSWNWQNDLLLTQGEWPVDVALHLQMISDRVTPGRRSIEFGPVLQTDIGRTQLNLNLIVERRFNLPTSTPNRLKYQWQVRHRAIPGLHFGLQGFGELGPWDHWSPASKQSHRAGPALFGTTYGTGKQALRLQAAWLWGRTYGQAGHMFTMRIGQDF